MPKPILPNIGEELTREALIDLNLLVSANAAYMASNLGGGRHGHLALMITDREYMEQMSFTFLSPQNQVNYPPTMGTNQEQVIGT